MISDVANWVLINVLTNTRVFTSLLALIILIVAGFLISAKKPAKKVPSKRILGAVLFVFATFVFLHANIADLANVFTIWATLILAGVAVFSFEESRRLREENRQKEERDRRERLLNEIIDWSMDIAKCEFLTELTVLPVLSFKAAGRALADALIEHANKVALGNLGLKYQTISTRSEYIKTVAKQLDESLGSKLHSAVSKTAKKLDTHKDITMKHIEGKVSDQEYKEHWLTLLKSAIALTKKAAKLID